MVRGHSDTSKYLFYDTLIDILSFFREHWLKEHSRGCIILYNNFALQTFLNKIITTKIISAIYLLPFFVLNNH